MTVEELKRKKEDSEHVSNPEVTDQSICLKLIMIMSHDIDQSICLKMKHVLR